MRLGPDFSRFGHNLLLEKIFLVNAGQNCYQTVTIFFLQPVSLTLFHQSHAGFGKVLLALQ